MKKMSVICISIMLVFALAACASASEAYNTLLSCRTLGDIMALEPENPFYVLVPGKCIYSFTYNGMPYRAIADMEQDSDRLPDVFDDDYDEKVNSIITPLVISELQDLSSYVAPKAELDSYIGEKGQALLNAGFLYTGHFITEEITVFYVNRGIIDYIVECNELVTDFDLDMEALFPDFTVKAIKVEGASFDSF